MYVKHGCSGSRTYKSWEMMIQRCTNPEFDSYQHYGGRGITVCDEWYNFSNFLKDMGERPAGKSLERVDVNKGYFKGNCTWVSQSRQLYNRRKLKANTTGRTGVYFHKASGKWMASINYEGSQIYLGLYENFEDAVKAREQAEIEYYGEVKMEGIAEAVDTEDLEVA